MILISIILFTGNVFCIQAFKFPHATDKYVYPNKLLKKDKKNIAQEVNQSDESKLYPSNAFEGSFTKMKALSLIYGNFEKKIINSRYDNTQEKFIKWENSNYYAESHVKDYKYKGGFYLTKVIEIKTLKDDKKLLVTKTEPENSLVTKHKGNLIGLFIFTNSKNIWKLTNSKTITNAYFQKTEAVSLGELTGIICYFSNGYQGYSWKEISLFIPQEETLKLVMEQKISETKNGNTDNEWSYDSEIRTVSSKNSVYNIIIHKTGIKEGNEIDKENIYMYKGNKYIQVQKNEVEPVEDEIDPMEDEVEVEEKEEEKVFMVVEKQPSFPGGEQARMEYLSENIEYPQLARESGIQGTVYVTFVVEKDGSITDVRVLRGIGGGCDEETIRVVKNMPKWEPGEHRGKPVRVQFNMPMRFTLSKGNTK